MAHNANPLGFETPKIANRCRELKLRTAFEGREPANTREKFLSVVHTYCIALALRGVHLAGLGAQGLPADLRHAIDNVADLEAVKWLET